MTDSQQYEQLRDEAKRYYDRVGNMYSPALKHHVNFNSEGFNHLIFDGRHSERNRASQLLRFRLLPLAVRLVGLSTTHQEHDQIIKEITLRFEKKHERKSKLITYWGIIAIVDSKKIKVVVRKIGENGALHFWSVYPVWKTTRHGSITLITTMEGDPDND